MNTNKFNSTDYVISHFVANDKYRPFMNKAYHQNGYHAAWTATACYVFNFNHL